MALITLLTDFGYRDPYLASLKAEFFTINSSLNLVDISHDIDKYDIQQAAFVFNLVYRSFPSGTVHLLGVEQAYTPCEYLIVRTEDAVFIAPDNGVLSLLKEFSPLQIIEITRKEENSFVMKNELVKIACGLAAGASLLDYGKEVEDYKKIFAPEIILKEDQIIGNVVFVDSYGNLLTNIHRDIIDVTRGEREIEIKVGREYLSVISKDYKVGKEARCIALYNNDGYLEIAMTAANASKLLGVKYESIITVSFKPKQSLL